MLEAGDGAYLREEAVSGMGVRLGRGDELHRHQPLQPAVLREVDDTHGAAAERAQQVEFVEITRRSPSGSRRGGGAARKEGALQAGREKRGRVLLAVTQQSHAGQEPAAGGTLGGVGMGLGQSLRPETPIQQLGQQLIRQTGC